MTSYVDYTYYSTQYGGVLIPADEQELFVRLAREASLLLDYFTGGHIDPDAVPEAVMNAACAICDMLYRAEAASAGVDGREIKSESNDGYQLSYVTETADGQDRANGLRKKAFEIARIYLSDTGLLFWGVSPC